MDAKQEKKGIVNFIVENKGYFFVNFFIVLTITFSILYLFGLVPESLKTIVGRDSTNELRTGELPITIKIPAINVDSQVYSPATTSSEILNDYLLKGAVRYPGSGLLGGKGNIFIFGHSTGIKVVNNQAFKTFNGLRNLKEGDLIYVYSEKYEYIYKVTSVKMESSEKALVAFNTKSKILTISTCSHFGEKSNRDVVESEFVSKKSIN
jgi:LPXTG-site transpeptidase (sortase) family protein